MNVRPFASLLLVALAFAVPGPEDRTVPCEHGACHTLEEDNAALLQSRVAQKRIEAPLSEGNIPCQDISGSYIRSFDQALIRAEQAGCAAVFTRVNGTAGRSKSSATVEGTRVIMFQSAPGDIQENGDIKFVSGVVYSKVPCQDISGSYIRSTDQALIRAEQSGCTAAFTRVNGTDGPSEFSAIVEGTRVIRFQSAPGDIQENGDIKFVSGIVYRKVPCQDISGSYIRSTDQALIRAEQSGCTAAFTRVNGTDGPSEFSAIVEGTRVIRFQSAPGDIQENGDIRFVSGVVYTKVKQHEDSQCSGIQDYQGWNNMGDNIWQDGHEDWLFAYGISCFGSLDTCSRCCSKTYNCAGWTWTNNKCYLKDRVDNCQPASGFVWAASGFCNPGSAEGHHVTCGGSPSPPWPTPSPPGPPPSGCGRAFGGKNSDGQNIYSGHGDGYWPSYQGTPCSQGQGDCATCCEHYGSGCRGWTWVNADGGKCYLKSRPNSWCETYNGQGSWFASGFCHPADWASCL